MAYTLKKSFVLLMLLAGLLTIGLAVTSTPNLTFGQAAFAGEDCEDDEDCTTDDSGGSPTGGVNTGAGALAGDDDCDDDEDCGDSGGSPTGGVDTGAGALAGDDDCDDDEDCGDSGGSPTGGVDTGGGGTADSDTSAFPAMPLAAAGIGVLGAGTLLLRRRVTA